MDNAITELLGNEATAGGVLMWMFEILRQPLNEKQRAVAVYRRSLPPIPSTVLFSYSRAQAWYDCVSVTDAPDNATTRNKSTVSMDNTNNNSACIPSNLLRRTDSKTATSETSGSVTRSPTTAHYDNPQSSATDKKSQQKTNTPIKVPPPVTYYEYRRRKASSLTTHGIVSTMCPSYLEVCSRVQREEESAGGGQRGARPSTSSASPRLPSSTLSVITNSLPVGELAAQVVRKAPLLADAIPGPSLYNEEGVGSNGDLSLSKRGDISSILSKALQQSVQTSSGAEAAVEYFDEAELGRMMFHGTVTYGLLQQFHHPPRSHKHEPSTNDVIIANWQPHFCHVSRRRGRMSLMDKKIPSQIRGDTWDPRVSEYGAAPGGKLQQTICEACNAIAERVYLVCGGVRLRKLSVVFKLNSRGQVLLQWCQAASVVTSPQHLTHRDELISQLPYAKSYTPNEVRLKSQPSRQSSSTARTGVGSLDRFSNNVHPSQRPSSAGSHGHSLGSAHRVKGNLYRRLDVVDDDDLTGLGKMEAAMEESMEEVSGKGGSAGSPLPRRLGQTDTQITTPSATHILSPTTLSPSSRAAATHQNNYDMTKKVPEKKTLMSTWEEVDRLYGPVRTRGLLTSRKLELMMLASQTNRDDSPPPHRGAATTGRSGSTKHSSTTRRGVSTSTAADVLRAGTIEREKDAAYEAMAPASWTKRFKAGVKTGGARNASAMLQLGRPVQSLKGDTHHHRGGVDGGAGVPRIRSRPSSPSSLSRVYRDLPLDIISGSPPPSRPHSAATARTPIHNTKTPTSEGRVNGASSNTDVRPGEEGEEDDDMDGVVYNNFWGAPSQLDNRLLTGAGEADSGPYSKKPLAADAGRLGMGGSYVATMRPSYTAPTPKPRYSRQFAPALSPQHSSTQGNVSPATGATPLKSGDIKALKRVLARTRSERSQQQSRSEGGRSSSPSRTT